MNFHLKVQFICSSPSAQTCSVSPLRWTMTRWRRLTRHSLTTLHAAKRPTTSDRCLRRATRAELSGSPTTGCHAGSMLLTPQLARCPSISLSKTSECTALSNTVRWSSWYGLFMSVTSPSYIMFVRQDCAFNSVGMLKIISAHGNWLSALN